MNTNSTRHPGLWDQEPLMLLNGPLRKHQYVIVASKRLGKWGIGWCSGILTRPQEATTAGVVLLDGEDQGTMYTSDELMLCPYRAFRLHEHGFGKMQWWQFILVLVGCLAGVGVISFSVSVVWAFLWFVVYWGFVETFTYLNWKPTSKIK